MVSKSVALLGLISLVEGIYASRLEITINSWIWYCIFELASLVI